MAQIWQRLTQSLTPRGSQGADPAPPVPEPSTDANDAGLTLIVAGNMFTLDDAEIVVEENRPGSGAFSEARKTGQTQMETLVDLPEMSSYWRRLKFSVLDFDWLTTLGDIFSVRPGGHATMPDFWTYGRHNFPVVSARLKAILEEAWPEGSYFFPCHVYKREMSAPPIDSQMQRASAVAGGPLGIDAPQRYFYWVIRNELRLTVHRMLNWDRSLRRKVKPRQPTTKPMYEMTANPAVGQYMSRMAYCCFLPAEIFLQRDLYKKIIVTGMTGFSEARGHTINRGENVAHV